MSARSLLLLGLGLAVACAAPEPGEPSGAGGGGRPGGGGGDAPATGRGGAGGRAGAAGPPLGGGGASGTGGGRSGAGGGATAGSGSVGGGPAGSGGRGGRGGTTGPGGATGQAGSGATGQGGSGTAALDCGPQGWVVEHHGPPANRVNYVILGDGFTAADLGAGGKFEQNVNAAMVRRFGPDGDVYARYRNFVNICAIKLVSTGAICGSSALGCCGDDDSRLADCDMDRVNAAFDALPASLGLDWRAVMLNGNSWWNTGAITMMWSGGHAEAPGAALHEGGHGFHQLADEYGTCTGGNCGTNTAGTGSVGTEYAEVNSTGNPMTTDGKWDRWIGFDQTGATGVQGTWSGSRYVGSGQYRPSANSMMNSLFCNGRTCNPNTSFNAVSREQMIMNIWRIVKPIDSTEPAAGAVASPAVLKVNVIDPAVIAVDWTVDGAAVTTPGTTFDTAPLAAGMHTVTARAYDNAGMDLVRYRESTCPASVTRSYCQRTAWKNATQTVTWTFTK